MLIGAYQLWQGSTIPFYSSICTLRVLVTMFHSQQESEEVPRRTWEAASLTLYPLQLYTSWLPGSQEDICCLCISQSQKDQCTATT